LNIPLGLALTEFIAETCIPTIAHHHDFYWERDRFLVNCGMDWYRAGRNQPYTNILYYSVMLGNWEDVIRSCREEVVLREGDGALPDPGLTGLLPLANEERYPANV